jgi:serine/threonine protein kinase
MVESGAEAELVEANKVRNIDPDQKYFVYAERACDRTIHGQTADSAAIEKCTPIRKVPVGKKAKLLVMSDGGDNLTDFAQSFRGSTLDFGRLRKALESMGNLFEGLKKLHDAGYVHFDIKPDNTVINSEFKTRFIDFGLTRSHLWKLPDPRYDLDYFAWPFQLHYLSDAFREGFHRNSRIVDQGRYLESALYTHLMKSREHKPDARDLGMISRREVTNGQVEYNIPPNGFLPSEIPLIQSFRDNPKKFVSDIFVSTDVYSLGRTLAIFYYDVTEHKPIEGLTQISHTRHPELVEFSLLWYTMTEMMSHVIQAKRWTLQQSHDYYNGTILPSISKYFPKNGAKRRGTRRKKNGGRTRRHRA